MAHGAFEISTELLVQLLHLPPDTEICQASGGGRNVELIVSHPDIKPDGRFPAKLAPEFNENVPGLFVGWGQH